MEDGEWRMEDVGIVAEYIRFLWESELENQRENWWLEL